MRQFIAIAVIALLGYYLYHEIYGNPAPIALPSFSPILPDIPAIGDLTGRSDKQRALEGPLPSGYDPAYIHPESSNFTAPNVTLRPSERAATYWFADAPTQCGPYFLYFHPSYWKGPPGPRRIAVTKMPPDANVESLFQLWAFDDPVASANYYPNTERGRYIDRADLRPVQFAEIMGIHVDGHTCAPYKPLTLTCSRHSPWC